MTFPSGVTASSGISGDLTDAQIGQYEKDVTSARDTLATLQGDLAHNRLSQYRTKKNLIDRIRAAEAKYSALLQQLHEAQSVWQGQEYRRKTQRVKGGVDVRVEVSLDGVYYSNPAPTVPINSIIWVRCVISDSHRGIRGSGVPVTHEIAHLTWVPGAGYVAQDLIPSTGHNVWFVSQPLVILRKFRAPGANTDKNFLVNVDVYEPQAGAW